MYMKFLSFKKTILSLILMFFLTSCGGLSKTDTRKIPVNAQERARKNVEEGRGTSIDNMLKRSRGTNYEFSSSNPMWRASLEILDFLPMTTVDYSGGVIISDWYTDQNSNDESIKITIRFLSNQVRSDSLKIIIHKKVCKSVNSCSVKILNNSPIQGELRSSIIRKAALLKKEAEEKKKK